MSLNNGMKIQYFHQTSLDKMVLSNYLTWSLLVGLDFIENIIKEVNTVLYRRTIRYR